MKQVGSTRRRSAVFIGIHRRESALVIVSADDPGPYSSQTEQDSRMYAHAARLPVFDPPVPATRTNARSARSSFRRNIRFRDDTSRDARLHSREGIELPSTHPRRETFPLSSATRSDGPRLTKYRAALHTELLKKLNAIADEDRITIKKKLDIAVVAGGYPYSLVKDVENEFSGMFDIIKIDMPYPLSRDSIDAIEKSY
jgi:indolepyruvate ferredoxin oxidoreductase alpha subunit